MSRYSSAHKTFTRASVIHQLGTPVSSTPFRQPLSVATLVARGHPLFQGCISDRSARVAVIDEYVLRGHVADDGAYKSSFTANSLAILTLGVSEVVFIPAAIADAVSTAKDVHHLYMAYSPSGILVAHRITETSQPK